MIDRDFGRLAAEHAAGWLADAVSLGRSLDWQGFSHDETLHAVDAATLPPEASQEALAWTAPGLRLLLADRLRDCRGGPAVVLDVKAIVRRRLEVERLSSEEVVTLGRLEVSNVLIHELGHARVAEARGVTLPAGVTLPTLLRSTATPTLPAVEDRSHADDWIRAYVHLSDRAARTVWPHRWWLNACRWDVSGYVECHVSELLDALTPELGTDEPIVSLLRRDPPELFTALFQTLVARRDAARLVA